MNSDGSPHQRLLSPLTGGTVGIASDGEVAAALIAAEVALVRAWAAVGIAPNAIAEEVSEAFAWDASTGTCRLGVADAPSLGESVAIHGTPVIALIPWMRSRVGEQAAPWIHRGATSQDIIDSALMATAARAASAASALLGDAERSLATLAAKERDVTTIARTLTQHAVPTTVGARVAGWLSGVRRARLRLETAASAAPAQLGGAAGTLASFVEIARVEGSHSPHQLAVALGEHFASELRLAYASVPWHTMRAPVTELGDALVQSVDAAAHLAADVSLLGRPEIGEVSIAAAGASSAMPHKRNPTDVVLIRAAGVRAPFLGATLHAAAASATDERSDGPWQAEWPVVQELAALAYGTAEATSALVAGLNVNRERVAANLAAAGSGAVSERLAIVHGPLATLEDLGLAPEVLSELTDPTNYTGRAAAIVDDVVGEGPQPR